MTTPDHKDALIQATELQGFYGPEWVLNLAAAYLDLHHRHEELKRLARDSLRLWADPFNDEAGDAADAALRAALGEE